MPSYLAIDYGSVHVGLAISYGSLAEPLEVVPASNAIETIKTLVTTQPIHAIIVGLSEGAMAEETRAFVSKLKHTISIPVLFQDETLTSQEAAKKLVHSSRKNRRGPDHHYAAAIILQDYLDTHEV